MKKKIRFFKMIQFWGTLLILGLGVMLIWINLFEEIKTTATEKNKMREDHLHYQKDLIKNEVDLNLADNTGKTALITACNVGNYNLVKILLKNGANVNQKDQTNKYTIQQVKQDDNMVNIISILMKYGAEIKPK